MFPAMAVHDLDATDMALQAQMAYIWIRMWKDFGESWMSGEAHHIYRIACIGEVMVELVTDSEGQVQLNVAGDTYNTAIYMARLLAGGAASVSYITALGLDRFSERIVTHMAAHGVGTGYLERRADRSPGLYAIDTDHTGERSFTYWRSDSAARTLFSEPARMGLDVLEEFDLIYLSGITLAILPPAVRLRLMSALDRFRASGGLVAYDSNHRPLLWESTEEAREVNLAMWSRTDIALPSVDDELKIHGETSEDQVLKRLNSLGMRVGAIKRGAAGPVSINGSAHGMTFAPVNRIVDTTAAGDSFNAGFLAETVRGGGQVTAMNTGHALASLVIQARGAIVPT